MANTSINTSNYLEKMFKYHEHRIRDPWCGKRPSQKNRVQIAVEHLGDEDRELTSNLEYKEHGLEGLIVIFRYLASVQLHQNHL